MKTFFEIKEIRIVSSLVLGIVLFNILPVNPLLPIGLKTISTGNTLSSIVKRPPSQTLNDRPLLSVNEYSSDPAKPKTGDEFYLTVILSNLGTLSAQYVEIDFPSGDFVPLDNGGTIFIQEILQGETTTISQNFVVSSTTTGLQTIDATIRYIDPNGNAYTETFTFAINVHQTPPTNEPPYIPVATPIPSGNPQLIIGGFSVISSNGQVLGTDQYLEPGSFFSLNLNLVNIGKGKASNILMALGGATSSTSGLSGAVGNFSIFSPVNASNIVSIIDIDAGSAIQFSQSLAVNNAANSGSYNLQISFAYNNPKGDKIIDDQIISLQVLVQPKVQVGLYTPLVTAYVDQPVPIPLMLINLSSKTIQLGQIDIACDGWDISPQSTYIGKIDSGEQWFPPGEFIGTPHQAGQSNCLVNIHYLDDFGKNRQISDSSLVLSVEQSTFIPDSQIPLDVTPTSSFVLPEDKPKNSSSVWNIFKQILLGFLGLDSASIDNGINNIPPSFVEPTISPSPLVPLIKP